MASLAAPKGKDMIRRKPGNVRVMNSNIPETSKWSPVSDAIVGNGEVVKTTIDNCKNTILYGKEKSPLPVFEKLCRENH